MAKKPPPKPSPLPSGITCMGCGKNFATADKFDAHQPCPGR